MSVADPESVASPSEGQQSSVQRTGTAPAHANGTSDDAISVGEITQGGRGSGESEAVAEDERQTMAPNEGEEPGEVEDLRSRLERSYAQLDEQRNQAQYWRHMYKIMVRVIAAQHEDPALAWLDEITHDRFAHLLSERKL